MSSVYELVDSTSMAVWRFDRKIMTESILEGLREDMGDAAADEPVVNDGQRRLVEALLTAHRNGTLRAEILGIMRAARAAKDGESGLESLWDVLVRNIVGCQWAVEMSTPEAVDEYLSILRMVLLIDRVEP